MKREGDMTEPAPPTEPKRWRDEASEGSGDLARARRLVAKVDAPVAPPAARARTFRRVEASLAGPRPSRAPVAALAGALFGALLTLVVIRVVGREAPSAIEPAAERTSEPRFAEISGVFGRVETTPAKTAEGPHEGVVARAGQRLDAGEHVVTADGSAELRVFGVGELSLEPSSDLVLRVDRGTLRTDAELARGALLAAIHLDRPERGFVVAAGPWKVHVVGTRFTVKKDGEADIEVEVAEGAVLVEGPGREVRVSAGERFRSREVASAERREVDSGAATAELGAGDETPTPLPRSIRARASRALREPMTSAHAGAPNAGERGATSARADVEPAVEDEPGAARTSPVQPRAPLTPEELYAAANDEPSPLRAVALFDRVAATKSSLAEVAAHQAARITMRIGKCTEAVERFDAMLRRWPATAYDEEARLDTLECHVRLGQLDLAAKDLEAFLARHPTSERSPELRFLRAELLRTKGEHRAAVRDYQAALGSRRDADARYFEGWCELQLGELAAADVALRGYLERYPDGRHAENAREALDRIARARASEKK